MEKKLKWYDHLLINSYWLGINISTGTITPILLPYLILLFMPPEEKNTHLATVRVIGLAVAMFVQPLAGMLSDRSTSKLGRRRPFILASALLSVLLLVIIGISPLFNGKAGIGPWPLSFLVLLIGTVFIQFSSNLGHGALQGVIPDIVPEDQRGRASGVKAVLELLPVFLVIFIGPLVDQGKIPLVVGIIAAGFLITMTVTMFFVKETPLNTRPEGSIREPVLRLLALTAIFVTVTQLATFGVRAAGRWADHLSASLPQQVLLVGFVGLAAMVGAILIGVYAGAWIGIGKAANTQKAFIWWVINRLLFLAAVGSIQGFAQFFLKDVLHMENAATMTTILLAVVAVFLIPSAIGGGYLADRIGRKRLIGLSGLVATGGTLLLMFSGTFPLVIISGCIIGLATGTFMATNWALGTDLAPKADAGKYLGISNLAGAGAGIVGAGIGGPLADFFNQFQPGLGYIIIFAIYAGLFLLSTLTLAKVKLPTAEIQSVS